MLLMTLLAPWAVAQKALPYSYGFEDNDLSADGWTTTCTSSSSGIKSGGPNHSGTYGFAFYYSEQNGALISPLLTGGEKGVDVSLWYMEYSSQYGDEQFYVGYTTDETVTDPDSFVYGSVITASTSWQEYTNTFPAGTKRIAVKYVYNDAFYLFLDDFTFETVASCPKPKDLEATNITAESATLTWTSTETPSNGYNVRYRTAEDPNASFFDDFETNTLTGWTIYTDGTAPQSNGWYTIDPTNGLAFEAHSGSYCASSWSWSTSAYDADNWLISPQVTFSKTLKFWVRTNASYPDSYEVLLSTTGTDEADFTETLQAMAPAPATGAWEEVSIDLTAYSGTGYIAIHHVDNDKNYLLIDDFGICDDPIPAGAWVNTTSNTNSKDITSLTENTLYDFEVQANCGGETSDWVASTFTTNPSCMPVANLTVSDATTTTISLTWTDQNSGSASYIVTDGDDNPVTVTNLTITGCTITGLTANTAYTFKVKADCGSTAETINVRTECNALSTIPYNEGFEVSSEIIYCWDLDGFVRLNNPTYAHLGNVSLYGSEDLAFAILPITTANTSALMLNFWWTNGSSGYDMGSLEVGYITDIDDYSTFVPVGTIDMSVSTNVYTHTDDFVFDGAPDGSRIALKYNEGYYARVLIDDVTVEYKPACMRPTNLVASNPTGHGATFAWDGNGSAAEDGWQLYISDDASVISTGYESPSGIIDADTNPFTVTSGLKPETDYYVWVRSHCEYQGYSPWSNPATFTTTEACPAPTGLTASEITGNTAKLSWTGTSESYVLSVGVFNGTTVEEGFEHSGSVPTDWTHIGSGNISINSTASRVHTGSYSLRFAGATSNNVVVLPDYGFEANTATISFWSLAENSTSSGTFQVGYVTDANDASTFKVVGDYSAANHLSYYHVENVSLASAPAGARIAFRHTSASNYYYWWIDDVEIVTGSVASWNEYTNITDQYYTVGSLTPETEYRAKVKGYCGSDGYSVETAPISFTTSAACPEQDGLEASNIQIHSAVISWDAHGTTEWNLRYSADNGTTWTTITKAITNPYTLEGLDAATDYLVQVQAKCAASDEWSASLAFTTKCDFVKTFPWSEDFESYTAGNFSATCWVNEHIAGSATYVFQVSTASTGTNNTKKLVLPDENDGNMIKLVLPGMTLPNSNYAFFIDVYRSDNYSTYITEGIRVFASTNGEIEGATELAFIPRVYSVESGIIPAETTANSWYTYALPINMSGTCYIILRGESKYGAPTYMDNFMVASCYPVGTLSYDNLASQTVDLHWTLLDNTQDAWQVCINGDEEHPIDITESDVVVEGVERTYSMSGLTAETPYTVKVRANCGGGDFGKWSNTISFTTFAACATPINLTASNLTMVSADLEWTGSIDVAAYTVQYRTAAGLQTHYFEGFEDGLGDWTKVDCANSTGIATGSSYAHTGNAAFKFSYNTNPPQYLVSPAISGITSGMQLEFWYKNGSTTYPETFQVGFSSTDNDVASFAFEDEITASDTQWHSYSVAVPATTKYLCFKLNSNDKLSLYIDDISIGAVVPAGSWQTAANDVTTWNYTLEGLTANVKYDARVYANCTSDPDTENAMTTFTTLADGTMVFNNASGDGMWSTADNWTPGIPTISDNAILRADATITGNAAAKKITFEGSPTPTLTINDGGSLQTDNNVAAIVKKHITGYTAAHHDEAVGYYLIANPLNSTVYSSSFATVGLTSGNYDIYSWSYSASDGNEWRNFRAGSFSSLTPQTGYLYANESDVDFTFTGTVAANNADVTKSLNYASSGSYAFNGWNLVGNPFACNAYTKDATSTDIAFYRMNNAGSGFEAATGAIKPMEGIFVKATATGQSFDFTREQPITSYGNGNLNISLANVVTSRDAVATTDKAIVRFDGGGTLEKFMFREDNMKIYIPQDGTDFAVVASEAKGVMPVNVKVTTTGEYTISISNEDVDLTYLHLIDRLTGEDVDLLIEDSYTFYASPRDQENRFTLVFNSIDGNIDATSEIFAYQNGNQIIVSGEGTLQVYDVMGRFVANYNVNGTESINASQFENAVYIFRLVGTDVKTQKIVIR